MSSEIKSILEANEKADQQIEALLHGKTRVAVEERESNKALESFQHLLDQAQGNRNALQKKHKSKVLQQKKTS